VAYCNLEDVSGEAQRKQPYSGTTTPTSLQVQKYIDGIAAEMDMAIQKAGYALPITEARALAYLGRVNAVGAASASERATVGRGVPEGMGKDTLYGALWAEYQKMLAKLEKIGSLGNAPMDSGDPASLWTDHNLDGSEEGYSEGGPWFTRDGVERTEFKP
jgi:hypothetical protein